MIGDGSSDTNVSPLFASTEIMDNIRSLIINQTIACENLDRKLNQVLQKQQELMEGLLAEVGIVHCDNIINTV
jgi:uncharacterized membrane protein